MTDAFQLLAEFREALDSGLRIIYGLGASGSDDEQPTSDDHHLIAFARAASFFHHSADPCAQLRADVKDAEAKHENLKQQVDAYGQEDFDPKAPKGGQQAPDSPPDDLVSREQDALHKLHAKQAELAACEKAAASAATTLLPDQISYELHRLGEEITYWACAPHPSASTYLWYEFTRKNDGSFASVPHPRLDSTPYPFWGTRPFIEKTGSWSGGGDYGVEQQIVGSDPPHWSPVFVMGTHEEEQHLPADPKGGQSPAAKRTVNAPDPPDAAITKKLHDLMSSPKTTTNGVAMIDAARPAGVNLRKRVAGHLWPPTTVRGQVKDSDLSGTDFTGDHGTAFLEDGGPASGFEASDATQYLQFGPIGLMVAVSIAYSAYVTDNIETHDRNWPGMDWDITVTTDPDVAYLSSAARPNELQVEIEQFALRPSVFRPHKGDWLQCSGRWVFDCGHRENNEHWTEIHPPELIVASHIGADGSTHASVITTGAWLGTPLKFVVFPPPRPTVTSKLELKVMVDGSANAVLHAEGWPKTNANHVVCTITPKKPAAIELRDTGLVGLSRSRFMHARIQCHWAEQTASVTVTPGGAGARVFFRDPDLPPSMWTELPTTGAVLHPISYLFRGAGSGWDFAPQLLTLDPGPNHFALTPTHESYPADVVPAPTVGIAHAPPHDPGLGHAVSTVGEFDEHANLRNAAWNALSTELLTWKLPAYPVSARPAISGAYTDSAIFVVRLMSYVDADGKAFTDLDSALIPPHTSSSGAEWYPDYDQAGLTSSIAPFLRGERGAGVAGAKLHATLVLGNAKVGQHAVAQIDAVTDAGGSAAFLVSAGTHPEDVRIALHVGANPINTWFTPTVHSPNQFFYPGSGSDLDPNRLPYAISVPTREQLTAAGLNLAAISAAPAKKIK